MPEPQTSAPALILRRTYRAPRERVFRAWLDKADLERWYTPGDGWTVTVGEHTPEVGGTSCVTFGAAGELPYVEVATFLEISPPQRLRFTTHLTHGDALIADTECTVDFIDRGTATDLVLTETGYPPEDRADRERGWGETLDHLYAIVEP
jgi:uncharacterized protein YndB with AHSA1/START domain